MLNSYKKFSLITRISGVSMLLQLSTWKETEAYLNRSTGIIIPIGSTEQHGPMGLIGTDAICPDKIASEISERMDVLVAPTIAYGMSQHHLDFPGSVTLRPTTLIAVAMDIINSLAKHGFTHMFFLNGHGGNVSSLMTAFSEVFSEFSLSGKPCQLHCSIVGWYEGKRVKELDQKHFGNASGSHATPGEISLSFYAHPDAIKSAEMDPEIAPEGHFRDAADFRRLYPDGRIGSNSSLATREIGVELCEAAIEDVIETYKVFLGD
jgi:creatinine amidohydrolase